MSGRGQGVFCIRTPGQIPPEGVTLCLSVPWLPNIPNEGRNRHPYQEEGRAVCFSPHLEYKAQKLLNQPWQMSLSSDIIQRRPGEAKGQCLLPAPIMGIKLRTFAPGFIPSPLKRITIIIIS